MKIISAFLPAIINDDASGLSKEEIKTVQTFVDSFPACIFSTDGEEGYCKCELSGLSGVCVDLSITRPHFKTRYINRRAHGKALETVTELSNLNHTDKGFSAELKRLVSEYQLSDSSAYYYVSNRSTKEWRAK